MNNTVEIDTEFDVENYMFQKLSKYLEKNSKFNPKVFSKAPKDLPKFPTVVFKETNNIDAIQYRSLDRRERVYQITNTIEIYTKDQTVGGTRVSSKTIMSELKHLVFEFFELVGATRVSSSYVESYDNQIERYVIVVRYLQTSWNRLID